ncbi:CidA/LrgA family protein [Brevibacillus humidisoli]|uniref:CidA/LrgA family protein n=1 Tax=Brevibacillus humidisoli TaxID=2895522 RepID=UPI001E41C7D8|nr:CidA/LrgA family protein [Brevibacillus humidisoli]UFJ43166.1 CidA/LrgA family protein [Brevibacillus humidisoli]
MWGWLIILGFYGVGALLNRWGEIPLPGSLIGMLLLALSLIAGWIPFRLVEQASAFLLKHMLLFFVPIIVGVVSYAGVIMQQPWPILTALAAGPPLVMLTVGLMMQTWKKNQAQERTAGTAGDGHRRERNA